MLRPLAFLAAIALLASPAGASQLWGGRGTPYEITPATGAVGAASPYNPDSWEDAASDPVRSPELIWGVNRIRSQSTFTAVNPVTGQIARTFIVPAAIESQKIHSIAIDPTTGVMYGASFDSLFTVDLDAGALTLLGPTTARIDAALGFGADGTLYAVTPDRTLVTVDKSTAALNPIAPLDLYSVVDLAARPEDGKLFALAYTERNYQLITIDPTAGSFDYVGSSLIRPTYLAFTNVPEPATVSLLLVAAAGVTAQIRRSRYRAAQRP